MLQWLKNLFSRKVVIGYVLESKDAKAPTIAYGNSACFDCYCTKDTIIPSGGPGKNFAFPPIDIQLAIPQGTWLEYRTRSNHGFKRELEVRLGVMDSGFGSLKKFNNGIGYEPKIYNWGSKDFLMEKGKACCQFAVFGKGANNFILKEMTPEEYEKNYLNAKWNKRGFKSYGSSDKK